MAKLDGHIPVRFSESLLVGARHLAQRDGLPLSTWIRRVVDRELAAREGRCPTCGHETTATCEDRRTT